MWSYYVVLLMVAPLMVPYMVAFMVGHLMLLHDVAPAIISNTFGRMV